MTHPLSNDQISVVVQGPIVPGATSRVLASIRTHLPGAEIILSTWKGAETGGLEFDVLILNEDPGPIATKSPGSANLNRLLWSTRQGLRKVNRPFCLKMRTDLLLTGPDIVSAFRLFPRYKKEYQIFHERIVISSVVTWRTTRQPLGLYHPSDLFGFGHTEDLLRWWSAPLYPFENRPRFDTEPIFFSDRPEEVPLDEMASEQYLWLSALRRTRNDVALPKNPSPDDLHQDLLLLLNNFAILEPKRAGMEWLRRPAHRFANDACFWSFGEYRHLYRREIEGRRFQFPPLSVAGKNLQLQLVRRSPAFTKTAWRVLSDAAGFFHPEKKS